MANVTHGDAYLYGVSGTITNASVQNFSEAKSFANSTSVKDENGNEVSRRYDDKNYDATCEFIIKSSYTPPAVGDTIAYDGSTYEIINISDSQSNTEHRKQTLTLKRSEYISYA